MNKQPNMPRAMGLALIHNLRLRIELNERLDQRGLALTRMEMHALDIALAEVERHHEEVDRLRRALGDAHSLTGIVRRQEPEPSAMSDALHSIETVTHRALHPDAYKDEQPEGTP